MNGIMLSLAFIMICLSLFGIIIFILDFKSRSIGIEIKQIRVIVILSIAITFAGYICLVISKHYSVDSFNLIFDMGPFWHLQLGRYTNCSFILLADQLGIHQVLQQQFFGLLWIVSVVFIICIISIAMIGCIRVKSIQGAVLIVLAVSIAFVNVYMMELMLFPEMFMVSIIGKIALGLSIYFALSHEKVIIRWCVSALYLVIALGNYQSYIGIYVSFVLIGIFLKWRDNIKYCYRESLLTLMIGGGVSVFNIVLVKLLIHKGIIVDSGRGASFEVNNIKSNLIQLIKYQVRFWNNADGLLVKGIMPVVGMVLFALIVYMMWDKRMRKQWYCCLIMLLICYVLGFAAHIIESRIILTPRSNLAVWAVISITLILLIVFYELKQDKRWGKLILTVIIGLLGFNIMSMQDMASNTQMVNAIDFVETEQICDKIKEYESRTGSQICKIAIRNDVKVNVYPDIGRYRVGELGARILITPYSNYRLIGYKLGRSLEKVDMPEFIYQNYFEGKDWDVMNLEEQMYFENDVAYLMIY